MYNEVRSFSATQMKALKNQKAMSFLFKKVEIESQAKAENRSLTPEEEKACKNYRFLYESLSGDKL